MKIHIVQVNDTIDRIAKKYDVDVEDIKKHNRQINNFKSIAPGMKLKIPVLTQTVEEELSDNSPSVESFYPSLDDITAYEEQEQGMNDKNKEKVEVNNENEIGETETVNTIYNQYENGKELVNENEIEVEGYSGDLDDQSQDSGYNQENEQTYPKPSSVVYYQQNQQPSNTQSHQQYGNPQLYQQNQQYQYNKEPQYVYAHYQQQPTYPYPNNSGYYYANPYHYRSGSPCPCEQQAPMSGMYQQQPIQNQIIQQPPVNQFSQNNPYNQGTYNQSMSQNVPNNQGVADLYGQMQGSGMNQQQPVQKQEPSPSNQYSQNNAYNQGLTENLRVAHHDQGVETRNGQSMQRNENQMNTQFNQQLPMSQSVNTQINPNMSINQSGYNQGESYFNPNIPFNVPVQHISNQNSGQHMTQKQMPNQMLEENYNMGYNINPNPYVNMGPVVPNGMNLSTGKANNQEGHSLPYQSNGNQQGVSGNKQMQELFRKENQAVMNEDDGFTVTKTKKKIQADLRRKKK